MFPSRAGSAVHQFTIGTYGYYSVTGGLTFAITSGAFPTANKVLYIPLRIPKPMIIQQLYTSNGATASGNVDIGVYSADGTKLVSSGSVAQSGINQKQLFNVTDTLIGRGVFYMGLTLSNTTGTFFRNAGSLALLQALGLLTETPGGFGLPANATFGAYIDAYYPICGILAQSVM